MRERLTPDRIRRFECPADCAQAFLWDSEAPGLALRATRAGAKSLVFQRKLGGTAIRITIGDPQAWPLNSIWQGKGDDRREMQRGAREEAKRLGTLIDQGIDPRVQAAEQAAATKEKREAARHSEAPALDAWAVYVTARKPKWGALSLRDHERAVKEGGEPVSRGRRPGQGDKAQPGALRALLALPLSELNEDRIRAWLKEEALRRPTHARLCASLLGGFLNWCASRPEYRGQVHGSANIGRIVRDELPKRGAKRDCLQREQLRPWFAEVRKLPNPHARAYLQILLLTGARREELAALEWANVDFRWRSLTLRDKDESKGGADGTRTIPLTPMVAELLRDLKARNVRPLKLKPGEKWQPSPWVFTSRRAKAGRIADPRIAHARALAAAAIEGLTLHGLRRSFGTLAEWVEVPAGIVAQIQGHKPSATVEKHYRQRPLDLLRAWHCRIEAWMLAEAGVEAPKAENEHPRALQAIPGAA
jgi:integrase